MSLWIQSINSTILTNHINMIAQFYMDDYFNKVNQEREQRRKDFREIAKITAHTDLSLTRFRGENQQSICFKDLEQFEFGEWYDLNGKVRFRLIDKKHNKLVFDCEMYEGGQFGWHYHQDCLEECRVLSGCLYDAETRHTYETGDVFMIPAGVPHLPKAIEDCELKVIFIKMK